MATIDLGRVVGRDGMPVFEQEAITGAPLSSLFEGGTGMTRTTVLGIGGTIAFPANSNAEFYDVSLASHWFRRGDVMVCTYKGEDEWVGELDADGRFVYPVSGLCAFTYRCPHFGDLAGVTVNQPAITRTLHDVLMASIQDDSLYKQEQLDALRLAQLAGVARVSLVSEADALPNAGGTAVIPAVDAAIQHLDANDLGTFDAIGNAPTPTTDTSYCGVPDEDFSSGYRRYDALRETGAQIVAPHAEPLSAPATPGNCFTSIRIPKSFAFPPRAQWPELFFSYPFLLQVRAAAYSNDDGNASMAEIGGALYKYPATRLFVRNGQAEVTDADGQYAMQQGTLTFDDDCDGFKAGDCIVCDDSDPDYGVIRFMSGSGAPIPVRMSLNVGSSYGAAIDATAEWAAAMGWQFINELGEVYSWAASQEEYVSGSFVAGANVNGVLRFTQYRHLLDNVVYHGNAGAGQSLSPGEDLTLAIPHGLAAAPSYVTVTPRTASNTVLIAQVTDLDETNITVSVSNIGGSDGVLDALYWGAR